LTNTNSKEKALIISSLALEKKAEDVKILDMRDVTYFCDYFVIAGGESFKKTTAIADHIIDSLYAFGVRISHKEGAREGQWIILDYSDVIVHVFQEQARWFYDLERLWGDAKTIAVTDEK